MSCGVTERLSKTAQNELMNIVTIFLGVSVGATASAENFLKRLDTIKIIILGLCSFLRSPPAADSSPRKIMCIVTKGKINPLIGSAGVSAVPMAARVAQSRGHEGQPRELPSHARHGSERRRSHRFGCRGGRVPVNVQGLINRLREGAAFPAPAFVQQITEVIINKWQRLKLPRPSCVTRISP